MQWLGVVTLPPLMLILGACSSGTGTVTVGSATDPTTVSNIASLAGVVLSAGDDTRKQTDNPQITAWNNVILDWSYVVGSQVATITVTPIATDTGDPPTIRVNGGGLSDVVVATGTASPDIVLDKTTIITLTVTAADGRTQKIYTLRITHLAASASNLSKLLLSNGAALSPSFSQDTLSYLSTVSFSVDSLTLAPTPQDPAATVTVNGQPLASGGSTSALPLAVGSNNVFTILVTAADGLTTRSYTLTVTRQGSGRLTGLGISCVTGSSCGVLNPSFDPDVTDYNNEQNYDVTGIQLMPVTEDPTATITVNGQPVTSGQLSQTISLAVGLNATVVLEITYFAADNPQSKQIYQLMFTRDPPPAFSQQGYLKASDAVSNQNYGLSVAFASDTIAVGAFSEGGSGAVYVYSRAINGIWSQQVKLKASNAEAGDQFGFSVALAADGNTLAVGVNKEGSAATSIDGNETHSCSTVTPNNCTADSGAVYVFTRSGGSWSQQAYIKASNTGAGDQFGDSVALAADGNTLAVGANQEASNAIGIDGNQNDDSASGAGAAYVFVRSGGTWSQQAYVKASNAEANDGFGTSVALTEDGNTLAVGANNEASNATLIDGNQNDNSAPKAGAAYVFTRSGSTWSQQTYVKASNTDQKDQFGISVALSGDTLAVGAYLEDSASNSINGNETHSCTFTLPFNCAEDSGAVYVYTRSGVAWSQQAYIKASNAESTDWFGASIALSGNLLAVGSYFEDSNGRGVGNNSSKANNSAVNSGAVYSFTRSGVDWSQQAYIKASNSETRDQFGHGVTVSNDSVAVGASMEDGPSNTI